MFADQAQELQPVRLAGIVIQHLRQHRFGLLPLALPNEVRSLQYRRGKGIRRMSRHGGSIMENSSLRSLESEIAAALSTAVIPGDHERKRVRGKGTQAVAQMSVLK